MPFPSHAQKALDEHYAKYGSTTIAHKLALMELVFGVANFYPRDLADDAKLGTYEYEWLERMNLIEVERA